MEFSHVGYIFYAFPLKETPLVILHTKSNLAFPPPSHREAREAKGSRKSFLGFLFLKKLIIENECKG